MARLLEPPSLFSQGGGEAGRAVPELPERSASDLPLTAVLECFLFVSAEPVRATQVAAALGMPVPEAEHALEDLCRTFTNGGGLQITRVAGGYQMCTRAEFAEQIARFRSPGTQRLSRAALEVLAIVAYRQPLTAPEIEAIRGVNCAGVLRTLLDRALVREAGRKDAPGRPILYTTTDVFLKHFGLRDLSDLPPVEEFREAA